VAVLLASVLIAFAVSSSWNTSSPVRFCASPISRDRCQRTQITPLRAQRMARTKSGHWSSGFNGMLEEIQRRDDILEPPQGTSRG